jgi:hypothetical protein
MKRFLLIPLILFTLSPIGGAAQVHAVDTFKDVCKGNARDSSVCKDKNLDGANPLYGREGIITNLVNLVSIIAGIAAVIIFIVAGLRFITSGNNPQEVATTRNMVIYAAVGLVIVGAAQLIVRLFISQV